MALEKRRSRLKDSSIRVQKISRLPRRFAICISDGGYPESLEMRKIYEVIPDESAEKDNFIRIIDETGEDYLYPAACFVFVGLSKHLKNALRLAS
jgi:hypothetical protein